MTARRWTPPELWLFAHLARRGLVATRDGGSEERAGEGDDAPFRVDIHARDEALHLEIVLRASRATLALAPLRVDGNPWRDGWVLELAESGAILRPGGPSVTIEDTRERPILVELRATRQTLSYEGGEVALADVAFHQFTRQSSSTPEGRLIPWSAPTELETRPWWEIDVGAVYLAELSVELADVPDDASITVAASASLTPSGAPPEGCARYQYVAADHRTADGHILVRASPGVVVRFLRVEITRPNGAPVALAVTALSALGAAPFAETLRDTMRRAFALHAQRPLFEARMPDGSYQPAATYAEIRARVVALAGALARRLEPSTRDDGRIWMLLLLENSPAWVTADLAALERGYVVAPLSPSDPDDRIAHVLTLVRPDVVLCAAEDLARVESAGARLVIAVDTPEYEALFTESGDVPPAAARDEDEVHSVLFTSGSTGAPKGAMRTYRAFHDMLRVTGAGQSPRHLSFQPLSHLSERMFVPWLLVFGATIGFSRGGAHLREELRAFEPTGVSSVPRLFEMLHAQYKRRVRALVRAHPNAPLAAHEASALEEARRAFGPRLLSVGVGSAPVSAEVLAFMRRCFADLWVSNGYGTTEMGTIAFDGRIASHVEVKLVPEDEASAMGSARGEIWVKSPHAVAGYLGEDGHPRSVLDEEGWYRTGDLGERDANGAVHVIGRLKNTVKLGQGEFVSAERIENALATALGVERVYVHAEPGAAGVAALVVTSRSDTRTLAGELRAHGRRVGLAPWELPRGVLAIGSDVGVVTSNGKLARGAIASTYGPRLGELASGVDEAGIDAASATDDLGVVARLTRIVSSVLRREVDPQESLVTLGADSLTTAEILACASEELGREIPLTTWLKAVSIEDLAARATSFASAGSPAHAALAEADLALVLPQAYPPTSATRREILVTGATGFLGAHLVEALVDRTSFDVLCLVRAADDDTATKKLTGALGKHGIQTSPRVRALRGDLAAPRLGIDAARWSELAASVDVILHAGAEVTWLAPYSQLRAANVHGTLALIELAATTRGKTMHFVSTISCADGDETSTIDREAIFAGSPYALTKWIAEARVRAAADCGLAVTVHRPAMIAPHTRRGVGNPGDFLHRYMAGVADLGLYLDLDDARIDMTPVDFVAEGIVALVVADRRGVYHLANVDQSLSYAGLGRALVASGVRAQPATYTAFRGALIRARGSRLHALASYFPETGFTMAMGPWPCAETVRVLAELGITRPSIDEAYIARCVARSI